MVRLQYDKLARDADEEEGYGDEGGKMFFNYLSNAYETFMSGDDEMFEKLDAELKEDFSEFVSCVSQCSKYANTACTVSRFQERCNQK